MTEVPLKRKSKNDYVNNKELYAQMIKYVNAYNEAVANHQPLPKVPRYIGVSIQEIATRYSLKFNFRNYSFRDEMICDAIENCLLYLHTFNPDRSTNPFAWFTQITYFAFLRRIAKEQKQQYIKQKSMINSAIMNNLADMPSEDYAHFNAINDLDMSKTNEFIANFEEKNGIKSSFEKKQKKKKKGIESFLEGADDELQPITTDSSTED